MRPGLVNDKRVHTKGKVSILSNMRENQVPRIRNKKGHFSRTCKKETKTVEREIDGINHGGNALQKDDG